MEIKMYFLIQNQHVGWCSDSLVPQAISSFVFLTAYVTFGCFKGHICSQENGVGDGPGTRQA